jgi:hypothetical protein
MGGLLSVHNVKGVGISGVVGAASQFAGSMAASNLAFVRNNWYGEGLILAAGAVLTGRNPAISHALAGAAGYSMALRKRAQSAAGAGATTAGEYDAGMIQGGKFDFTS